MTLWQFRQQRQMNFANAAAFFHIGLRQYGIWELQERITSEEAAQRAVRLFYSQYPAPSVGRALPASQHHLEYRPQTASIRDET